MNYLEWQMSEMKTEKLAEWWDVFNSWNYPDDFIIIKPIDWDSLPLWDNNDKTSRTKYIVSKPYTTAIKNVIGEKECLRYHHIHNLKMTNFKFDAWWLASKFNGFIQRTFDSNFYFDIYNFMNWREIYE